jgi:hypothetical protein
LDPVFWTRRNITSLTPRDLIPSGLDGKIIKGEENLQVPPLRVVSHIPGRRKNGSRKVLKVNFTFFAVINLASTSERTEMKEEQ